MTSFNWSIEQLALLNPCDFSNTEDFIHFKQIDEQIVSKQLDEENDDFFSQNQIIPSPKTPKKSEKVKKEMNEQSVDSKWSPIYKCDKTPDCQNMSRDSLVIDSSFKTPSNCSKSKQKKKLFRDEHYLLESVTNSSRKDSVIDSQSLFSPIYSPNWRNTSLSHRITFLSPICSKNEKKLDDVNEDDDSICEASMKTEIVSHTNMTYDMISIESPGDRPKNHSSIYNYLDNDFDDEFDILCNNDNNYYDHCDRGVLKRFLTKTSTPSHM